MKRYELGLRTLSTKVRCERSDDVLDFSGVVDGNHHQLDSGSRIVIESVVTFGRVGIRKRLKGSGFVGRLEILERNRNYLSKLDEIVGAQRSREAKRAIDKLKRQWADFNFRRRHGCVPPGVGEGEC